MKESETGAAVPMPVLHDERVTAKKLGVSARTLQTWRVRGGGPVFTKIGKRILYDALDLAAYVRARRFTSTRQRAGA